MSSIPCCDNCGHTRGCHPHDGTCDSCGCNRFVETVCVHCGGPDDGFHHERAALGGPAICRTSRAGGPVTAFEPKLAECDLPPKGWYCTRGKGHSGPCAARPTPMGEVQDKLQALVEALGFHYYEAASVNLQKGEPLKVESLEATMECLTFINPYYLKKLASRCARAAKVCRFFRLNTWADLFLRAEGHFLADYEHSRIHLHRPERDQQGAGPSQS